MREFVRVAEESVLSDPERLSGWSSSSSSELDRASSSRGRKRIARLVRFMPGTRIEPFLRRKPIRDLSARSGRASVLGKVRCFASLTSGEFGRGSFKSASYGRAASGTTGAKPRCGPNRRSQNDTSGVKVPARLRSFGRLVVYSER